MEWLKKLFRTQEPLLPASDPDPMLRPVTLASEEPETKDFTEIGGSPVPGLTLRHVLRGHTGEIYRIAWSPDGAYLASPSQDATIRIWDARSGTCVCTLHDTPSVLSVAWSPDGQRLASSYFNRTIRLWDAASGQHLQTLEGHTDTVNSVVWSPDGRRLASGGQDHRVLLWEAKTQEVLELGSHITHVLNLSWAKDR